MLAAQDWLRPLGHSCSELTTAALGVTVTVGVAVAVAARAGRSVTKRWPNCMLAMVVIEKVKE